MQYRSLKKEDAETIFLLGKSDFGSKTEYSWDWNAGKVSAYLKESFGFGIVCIDKNAIIGFILVEREYSSQKPDVSWLTYVFVKKEYRRRNIAGNLMKRAFSKLKKIGKTDLITDVYLKNKSSLEFFKANEFKIKEKWAILSKQL